MIAISWNKADTRETHAQNGYHKCGCECKPCPVRMSTSPTTCVINTRTDRRPRRLESNRRICPLDRNSRFMIAVLQYLLLQCRLYTFIVLNHIYLDSVEYYCNLL